MASIEKDMNTKFGNNKHRAVTNIVFTGTWITGNFETVMKPFGLSSPQFNILRILRGAKDWLNMHEVKHRMIQKSPNATRLCDKLESKELIQRKKGDVDKRSVFLIITVKGMTILDEIDRSEGVKAYINFFDNITDEEAIMLSSILDKLRG